MDAEGQVRIVTGVASIGQGVETAMAQICASVLGTDISGMEVIHGQTDLIEQGLGAFATRVTVMTGSAVKIATENLIEAALEAGARLLQAERGDLVFEAGTVRNLRSWQSMNLGNISANLDGGLMAEGRFASSHMTYPYGIHVAQVKVDPDTCSVTIERYVVAFDVGRAVNPMLVEGQIVGAVAQGVGGALYEEFVYSDTGQPLAASFADYLMPTVLEMPPVETLICEDAPSPINPLGVKGAGEGGITAAGAAIASAVDDAIGSPGLIKQLPITPDRLSALLRKRRSLSP